MMRPIENFRTRLTELANLLIVAADIIRCVREHPMTDPMSARLSEAVVLAVASVLKEAIQDLAAAAEAGSVQPPAIHI